MENRINKKGLSDVITNVLIILLVIVAIGIIAAFVMPLLRNTGNQVTEGTDCLSVNVAVASCVWNSSITAGSANNTLITLSRGAGSYNVGAVKYIIEKSDGTTAVVPFSAIDVAAFSEFASIVKPGNFTTMPTSAGVAVTIANAKNSCPETPRVACTKIV